MTLPTTSNDLQLVAPIGVNIHLYEPPPSASSVSSVAKPNDHAPSLIILCTWLGGASPQRINKYITGHHAVHPSSAILVITTQIAEMAWLPFTAVHARLQPARDVIRRFTSRSVAQEEGPSVLLHIFSSGGCNVAIQLALSFLSQNQDHSELEKTQESEAFEFGQHIRAIVFDCCPGDSSFTRLYNAAAVSLPRAPPSRAIGTALLYPAIGLIYTLQNTGIMSSIDDLRLQLNDPALFGSVARRLYLYSREDRMVRWQDVESHLEDARSKQGYLAVGLAFSESAHCAIHYSGACGSVLGQYSEAVESKRASAVRTVRRCAS